MELSSCENPEYSAYENDILENGGSVAQVIATRRRDIKHQKRQARARQVWSALTPEEKLEVTGEVIKVDKITMTDGVFISTTILILCIIITTIETMRYIKNLF